MHESTMHERTTTRTAIHRRLRFAASAMVLFCLLASGCGAPDRAAEDRSARPAGERPGAAEADELMAVDEAFFRATDELGAAGWVDFFASDGRMVVNGREIVGKEAIREAMDPFLSTTRLEWEPSRAVARSGGGIAYTTGRYRARRRDHPDSVVSTGTYVTIWERQGDGGWKVSLDVGSADPEPRP